MLPSELTDPRRFYPPRDSAGAIVPHKMGLLTWLRILPDAKFLAFFDKMVPAEYWAEEVEDGEFRIVVSCPCGLEPEVKFGGMAACECDRCYLHDGREVRVGRPEEEPVVD